MSGVAARVLAVDVLARLQGLEGRGGNLSGVNQAFGGYMKGSIDRNFAAQGRPDRWPPLAFDTLDSWAGGKKSFWGRSKKTGKRTGLSQKGRTALAGRLILTDSTRLRNSIYYIASGSGVIVGTNVVYAAIHQFGGRAGRGLKVTIPARPYLLFQDEDIDRYEQMLVDFVMTGRIS